MITGRKFEDTEIAKRERESLDNYYDSDDPQLADGITYYAILFREFLKRNADKTFQRMDKDRQTEIMEKEMSRFQTAMMYSFNKGHQSAFAVLLMDTKNTQKYDEKYFKNPMSLNNFLYTFDQTIAPDVFDDNLRRDANELLINYTRRHFENGYSAVMRFGKIFFKKGAGVAFDQIRKKIVGVDYDITGYSHMLKVPYNQEFEVTPAFKGKFCLESTGFEEWDVYWDATYSAKFANNLVAKVLVHGFTVKQIKAYAEMNASAYKMLVKRNILDKMADDEVLYMVEINFALINPEDSVRLLESTEYQAIRVSLASTISQRLKVDGKHIFITK